MFKNVWPKSSTYSFSKIVEFILWGTFFYHLSTNNVLHFSQHGLQKSELRSSCQLEFFYMILKPRDSGDSIIDFYFDFAEASDNLFHKIVLSQVSAMSFQGNLFYWLQTFVASRSQEVCVNHTLYDMGAHHQRSHSG